MENSSLNMFSLNLKQILIEEIALDGLEGITPEKLFKHVEKRISRPLTHKLKSRLWNIVLSCEDVEFYKLPEPRESFELLDRFSIIDEDTGNLLSPENYLDGPYTYSPVKGDHGSCTDYDTRMLIPKNKPEVQTLENVSESYENTLVLVASLKERFRALAPHEASALLLNMTPTQFCMLELIGRARENGQVTVSSNLLKIMKDPKTQFYNRKSLEKMGLVEPVIIIQNICNRGTASILLRLKRYYQPKILSAPKHGKMAAMINHLITKPDFCDDYDSMLKNNVIDPIHKKKLKKMNLFKIIDEVIETPDEVPTCSKKPRKRPRVTRYIRLNTDSDIEDEDEEDGSTVRDVTCQYKVGVTINRQAYERFLDAGLRGLTQQDLCHLLHIGYYAARRIVKVFCRRNIIREVHEDGRNNSTPRFVAIASLQHDTKYDDAKDKLLKLYDDIKTSEHDTKTDEDEIPAKKPRFELEEFELKDKEDNAIIEQKSYTETATSLIESFESKKRPTLRQIQFAIGILKVTREKLAISGHHTVSQLVASELSTNLMDRKPMKKLIDKLALDGQVRIFSLKWPLQERYIDLICAPNVDIDHPILKAKYKELYVRSLCTTQKQEFLQPKPETKLKNAHAYKRYMRVRKLHEFIFDLVYGGNSPNNDLPEGFTSLLEMIPEMSVGLAIGLLQKYQGAQICELRLTDKLLATKLKDSPNSVFQSIFASKNLRATLISTMTILATFGLVQLCNRTNKPVNNMNSSHLLKYSFYVNKNAVLLDTRGDWPRDEIPAKLTFNLENNDAVQKYWNSLYEIAVNTRVKDRDFDIHKFEIPKAPVYPQEGAIERDDARIVSDGKGAAGLHSAYYLESQTLWVTSLSNVGDPPPKKLKPKLAKLKFKTIHHKKTRKPRKVIQKKIREKRPRLRGARNLHWSEYDDEIILLCRAAVMILSPEPRPGCYTVRNSVAHDLIADPIKSVYYCHRRSTARRNQSDIDKLVAEFKKRKEFPKYDDLLTKIRRKCHSNMTKFIQEAKLPTMELVWLLYQIRRSESFIKPTPCVAIDYESLKEQYNIIPKAIPKQYDMYKTGKSANTIERKTLKEVVMMTLFLTGEETQISVDVCVQLYRFLETKREMMLKEAVADLRSCGAIVCIKKHLLHQNFKNDMWNDVQSPNTFASIKAFGIAKACQRRMACRLNTEFADQVAVELDKDLVHNIVGSPETNCVLLEAYAAGNIVIATQNIPVVTGADDLREEKMNEIDEESKVKLKSGNIFIINTRGVKKMADLYPSLDYENILKDLISESIILQIKEENESNEDPIIEYLLNKGEEGCSFAELKAIWNGDNASLITRLEELENQHTIKRVGYYENRIVHTKHCENWSVNFSEHIIIPTPWIQEDVTINKSLFMKLCALVMNKLFENPGKTITDLAGECDCIASRNIQTICMFLMRIECVSMKTLVFTEPDLFSEDIEPEILDEFNKYAPQDTIAVFPAKEAISKFSIHRKAILSILNEEN